MLLQLGVYYLRPLKAVAGGACGDCVWPLTPEPAQASNNLGVSRNGQGRHGNDSCTWRLPTLDSC